MSDDVLTRAKEALSDPHYAIIRYFPDPLAAELVLLAESQAQQLAEIRAEANAWADPDAGDRILAILDRNQP